MRRVAERETLQGRLNGVQAELSSELEGIQYRQSQIEDEDSISELKKLMNQKVDEAAKESKALNKAHHRACIGVNSDLQLFYQGLRQGAIVALQARGVQPNEDGFYHGSLIESTISSLLKAGRDNLSPDALGEIMKLDPWVDAVGNVQLKVTDEIIEKEVQRLAPSDAPPEEEPQAEKPTTSCDDEDCKEEHSEPVATKRGPGRPKKNDNVLNFAKEKTAE